MLIQQLKLSAPLAGKLYLRLHKLNLLRNSMSGKKRLFMLLLLTLVVLMFTSTLSEANDTYNFYFQKAPGPVTVNQGAASAPPSVMTVGPDGLPVAPPQAAPTVASSNAELSTMNERSRHWYMSLGYYHIGSKARPSMRDQMQGSHMLIDEHFSVSLEYDLLDRLGVFAEGNINAKSYNEPSALHPSERHLTGTMAPNNKPHVRGPYFTYTFGGALNLIRTGSERTAVFVLGPVGGISSHRYFKYKKANGNFYETDGVHTAISPFAGLRARLLMFNTMGVDVSARRLIAAKDNSFRASVAFAF